MEQAIIIVLEITLLIAVIIFIVLIAEELNK